MSSHASSSFRGRIEPRRRVTEVTMHRFFPLIAILSLSACAIEIKDPRLDPDDGGLGPSSDGEVGPDGGGPDGGGPDGGDPAPRAPLVTTITAYDFGKVTVANPSVAVLISVRNQSNQASGALTLRREGDHAEDFEIQDNGCTVALPPGEECKVKIVFKPV